MKRLTGRAAIDAWPERLADVQADPTDDHLQRLCALLDVVDHWVVERWEKPSHEDRMTTLANMRAEARDANRSVSLSIRSRQAEVGRANGARKAKDRPAGTPEALVGAERVNTPERASEALQRA